MSDSQYKRWVDDARPLSGGWWRLKLSCGHSCNVLSGNADPQMKQMACLLCRQQEDHAMAAKDDV